MNSTPIKSRIWKEGEMFVALNPDTGVSSFGNSRKEAMSALKEAVELYTEDTP